MAENDNGNELDAQLRAAVAGRDPAPTTAQLEAALRYLWDAWAEAEGDGQPWGWVFGPDAELRAYFIENGIEPSRAPSTFSEWREAPAEIQATIRAVLTR